MTPTRQTGPGQSGSDGVRQPRPMTGRKVLIIAVSAFGVILAANLTLAFNALGTFPGLEVQNSYVASQNFNERLAAQTALGWNVEAEALEESVVIRFTGDDGAQVTVREIDALLGAATHVRDDQRPDFRRTGPGEFRADVALPRGNWNIRMTALAPDGTEFQQRIVLDVR